MKQQIEFIKDLLLNKNGHIYICGSTKMGGDVQNLLKEALSEEGFKALEKEKRLIKELWGWPFIFNIEQKIKMNH